MAKADILNEAQLKTVLKEGNCNLYVLYGEESYLTEQYARKIARETVDPQWDAFNLQQFDGQVITVEQLEDAVETLPMMTDRKCVMVRDLQVNAADGERLTALIEQVPDSCVLVIWQMTGQPDSKKPWKTFLDTAVRVGTVVKFGRKTIEDVVKMLVAGAKRRGCILAPADARYLVEQAGNDLQLLLNEIDKLTALVGEGGTVTREVIDAAATKNLEAKVFDLSKAILGLRPAVAYGLLHQLAQQKEEPLPVLAVLSTAFCDIYRAKAAVSAGQSATAPAEFYKSYKGKEFRLRNNTRLSVALLRDCLDCLAKADRRMKFGGGDPWMLLERTVATLLCRVEEG